MANPREHGNLIVPEIVYCLNDEDIEATARFCQASQEAERVAAPLVARRSAARRGDLRGEMREPRREVR
jgi:hypothetical protein